ncbi:MAG: HNH endonuclease [Dehalococcoidales bacterium]|nr:HNH endonuclease [Dehalococcoidales bacterium]
MIFGETRRKHVGTTEQKLLFDSQKGRCMYCGRKLGLAYLHVDHKTPISRDGSNKIRNLQLICGPCNTRKGSMTDGEFRRKYGLTPATKAKGPPAKAIPQSYFEKKTKEIADKKAKRKKKDGGFWGL